MPTSTFLVGHNLPRMTDHPPFQRRPAARKPRKTSGGLLRRLPQWLWLGLLGVIIVWMGVRYVLPAELGDEKGKKGKQTEASSKSKRSNGDESEAEASKDAKSSKDQPKGVKATVRSWLGLETGKKKKGEKDKKKVGEKLHQEVVKVTLRLQSGKQD
jgi:hypothetical protein